MGLRHQWDVAELFRVLRDADAAAARPWSSRVAGQVELDSSAYLAWLLRALQETGAAEALHALAARVAADAGAEATQDVARFCGRCTRPGRPRRSDLAARAVEAVEVEDPDDVAGLLTALRAVAAVDQARNLLARDPGRRASLEYSAGVADLADALHAAGAAAALRSLASRAAAQVSLEDGEYTARLLRVLRAAGRTTRFRSCWPATQRARASCTRRTSRNCLPRCTPQEPQRRCGPWPPESRNLITTT